MNGEWARLAIGDLTRARIRYSISCLLHQAAPLTYLFDSFRTVSPGAVAEESRELCCPYFRLRYRASMISALDPDFHRQMHARM